MKAAALTIRRHGIGVWQRHQAGGIETSAAATSGMVYASEKRSNNGGVT